MEYLKSASPKNFDHQNYAFEFFLTIGEANIRDNIEEVYKLQVGIQITVGIGKMQNKFPRNDKFPILSWIMYLLF